MMTRVVFQRLWRPEATGEMANIPRVGEFVALTDDGHAIQWRVTKVIWKLEPSGSTAFILLEEASAG